MLEISGAIGACLDMVPVPGLRSSFLAFKMIWDTIQAIQALKEQLLHLTRTIAQLLETLDQMRSAGCWIQHDLDNKVPLSLSLLGEISQFVKVQASYGIFKVIYKQQESTQLIAHFLATTIQALFLYLDMTLRKTNSPQITALLDLQEWQIKNASARTQDQDSLNTRWISRLGVSTGQPDRQPQWTSILAPNVHRALVSRLPSPSGDNRGIPPQIVFSLPAQPTAYSTSVIQPSVQRTDLSTNLASTKKLPLRDSRGKFIPTSVNRGFRSSLSPYVPSTPRSHLNPPAPLGLPSKPSSIAATLPVTLQPPLPANHPETDPMSNNNGLRMFWGDGEIDGENAQDFINGVERSFLAKVNLSEADKVRTFELWLKLGRAAKSWWNSLAVDEKDTWAHLRVAFEKKWPEKLITERTMEEQHATLEATVLKEESLGKRVKVDGVEEFSHVVWADKLERLSVALKDNSGLLIPTVRRSMPRALKLLVGRQHRTWPSFCDAIRRVSITELEEKLEIEEEQRAIQTTITRLEQLQQSHTWGIREAMSAASLGPIQHASPAMPPAAAPALTAAMSQYRPDAERLVDVVRLALPIQPRTPAGNIAYQAQITDWNARHAGRPVNEMRPYPLSPGTSPVASGECWKCGHTGHRGTVCSSSEQVPSIEQKWRSIAATISRRAEGAAATGAVNLVTEDGGFIDQAEYDARVIADYLAAVQGNADGSST
ncbi:hypothetical protein B0H34DRAFT_800549 [Crassisporium funariophilum]|nr:hypothetical protein B0H34DRAFT_800549 [Crassisporium funariophilum]